MSFDENVPSHKEMLETQRQQLIREQAALIHDCDCDYCEYDGIKDGHEEDYDKIQEDIDGIEQTIKKLDQWLEFKSKS